MSELERLIEELCPEGVSFANMVDIGSFYGGLSGKSKADFTGGNAKFITYMNVYSNIALKTDVSETVVIGENERQNTVQYGDILFTGSSETPDECGMSSVLTVETDESLYLNSFCFGFRLNDKNILLPGFSKYLFRSEDLRKQISRTASGVTRFNVSKEKMKKVQIPLPPIEVQREIVRILDNFTKLTAELTAELTARKKQYEYYRNNLLSFGDDVPVVRLGEIYDSSSGLSKGADEFGFGSPFLSFKTVFNNPTVPREIINLVNTTEAEQLRHSIKKGDVFVTRTSETLEELGMSCAALRDYPKATFNGFTKRLRPKENAEVNPQFAAYFFRSSLFRVQIGRMAVLSTRISLNDSILLRIRMPLPSLEEQARIADILDKFDALTTDISSGLPAEIAARQQQYEYYRDKLLSFKEVGA